MKLAMMLIRQNKNNLTAQQARTLKGQCRAGDIDGALKGLHRILRRL